MKHRTRGDTTGEALGFLVFLLIVAFFGWLIGAGNSPKNFIPELVSGRAKLIIVKSYDPNILCYTLYEHQETYTSRYHTYQAHEQLIRAECVNKYQISN